MRRFDDDRQAVISMPPHGSYLLFFLHFIDNRAESS